MLTTAMKREVIAALLRAEQPELATAVSRMAVGVIVRLGDGGGQKGGGSAYRALAGVKQYLYEASRTMSQSKAAAYLQSAMAGLAQIVRVVSESRAKRFIAQAVDAVRNAQRRSDRGSSQSLINSAMQYVEKAQYALTD